MKKTFITLSLLLLLFVPIKVKATEYNTMNLEEVLTEEQIDHDLGNYKETDDQITIYLFRGKGCGFCRSFITFLNNIVGEYGQYFKLVSYETWNDSNNKKLLNEVSDFLGEKASGVPYIVIGDKSFVGYDSSDDAAIKKAIKDLYDSNNRYDVFEQMNNPTAKRNQKSSTSIIWWTLAFVGISTIVELIYVSKKNKELNNRIDDLEKLLKEQQKPEEKKTKRVVSKEKK